ncbi:GCN5 family N-acetyltransferase [Heyndrickxia sporothermodurans]|nr:GCN5 family N-acetyltransferase [Heyndrickxia sporothermodurans]
MKLYLEPVTRDNWEAALALKVKEEQSDYVPSVAVSLAKVFIKPDGENVEYLPFAIFDQDQMVGFIMHAYDDNTSNMYWINGFLIDESHQKKGYGKQAMLEMIHWITMKFPQCKEIRLTVHKANRVARKLYEALEFVATGEIYGEENVMRRVV